MRRALLLALSLAGLAVIVTPTSALGAGRDHLVVGSVPLRGMSVVLYAARSGAGKPTVLGRGRSRRGGGFALRYRPAGAAAVKYLVATRPGGGAEAGFPVVANAYRLAAATGVGAVPRRVTLNERTTVAMGYAMAQFIDGARVAGKDPGLRNAAAMTGNLARLDSGRLSGVLRRFPNGNSTSTMRTFDSLANLLGVCRVQGRRCAKLLRLAGAPGGGPAANTLEATTNLARYPWHNTGALFGLSLRTRTRFKPALPRHGRPDAWTLALRFEGGGKRGLDGPGNFAIDAEGGIWVGNNYEYSRESRKSICFGRSVFRFTPTGRYYPGSPYESGGTSGVGFGITIDPREHVWVGNFGFEGKGCRKAAPHNSVSEYLPNGQALSPELERTGLALNEKKEVVETYKGGWEVGGINWPQATVSDQEGNIWVANCGNNSITRIAGGNPLAAANLGEARITAGSSVGFERPFGAAVNAQGDIFVTGNSSNSVLELSPSGEVLSLVSGGGLHQPLAAAVDDNGYVWVSNSKWVVAPCPNRRSPKEVFEGEPEGGRSVTLIKPNGQIAPGNPITGAGLQNPWGVAVDGAGQVWVANFGGRRLSELCGTEPQGCPPGKRRIGAAISPEGTGYGFDGLTRDTGVAIDPSGNVWLANNWKNAPIQTNPGGYQIVAYLGMAAPVKTPQIGVPEAP